MSSLAIAVLAFTPHLSPALSRSQALDEVGGLARPVPAGQIELQDGFWRNRLRVLRTQTLPLLRTRLDESGAVRSFERTAEGKKDLERPQNAEQDATVYAWIEAVAHSLLAEPGAKERERLEKDAAALVALCISAQGKDGYLHTPTLLDPNGSPFTDLRNGREFFCAGRLIEAGLAWEDATGDTSLRAAGVRFATLLEKRFGKQSRTDIGGRPGLSLALAKLARVTGRTEWLDFAAALVERRGSEKRKGLFGIDWLDDLPPIGSKEARGPLGIAAPLFAGMIEIATLTGWADFEESSLSPAWDIARRKAQPSGAVGVDDRGLLRESYDWKEKEPLASAGDTLMLLPWYRGLARATTHPLWFDEIERLWTNVSLCAVSSDGQSFPEALPGPYTALKKTAIEDFERVRLLPTVVEDVFFTDGATNVWLGMYLSCSTELKLGEGQVSLRVESTLLQDGKVMIHVDPQGISRFTLRVRIPRWAKGKKGTCRLGINDRISRVNVDHGDEPGTFLTFERVWKKGDRFTLELPMDFRCEEAPKKVNEGRGRCAVLRGPQAYVFLPGQGAGADPIPGPSPLLILPSAAKIEESPERLPEAPRVVLGRVQGTELNPITLRFGPWWLSAGAGVKGTAQSLWARRK